ncbi:Beta-hexosaminidase [Colletotrichum sp. SAR 10_86]|nr:Beta-hexosaminidase [Colletotrichum sp. SAR 10_65]KAI8206406.1 Beta-hexosaminidase [Colletotrichum sp. SAR 10_76]KAI8225833.1 Beta-hexosaminidase [Colletotrichum sp. SAR 10_86]KAI8238768.1 Beta-hexosaminidase [Colletotrichum sp. SAR 10_77]KAJ5006589.1 Beta-hexosaminidase [Colletotrichum sp. SAR 10_66]
MLPPLVLVSLSLAFSQVSASVWPAPKKLSTGSNALFISQTLEITYNGGSDTEKLFNMQLPYTYGYSPAPGSTFNSKDIVQGGVSRAMGAIFQQNFVPWKFHPKNSQFEPDVNAADKKAVTSLKITQTGEDKASAFKPLAGEVDESYSLNITEDGAATLEAKSSIGVLRGLETFSQLFYKHTSGTSWYTPLAPISVEDEPVYSHRGILIDVARNWYPVEDVLRVIDAMSWNKLNRIHIHITDSQSWPLDIPAMPDLSAKGAYQKGLSYTPADLAKIQEYAVHRGIEPIIEIDMPGHIGSVSFAYPELIVAYNEKPYQWWCLEPPCGAFKMNDSRVDDFLDKLFDDLLPRVNPYSAYFHTGGDELNKNDSMLDDGVKSNSTEILQPLLQKFMDKNHARIRKHGLVPFVWEEMALEWNITLGDDVVIQSWLGNDAVKNLTSQGHKVIDSNYNLWYLDCGRGHWMNFDNGAAFEQFYPFNDWCTPAKGWRLAYSHDPRANLTEAQAKLVLGGEVAAWSESIDSVSIDGILWPRASAAGEVLWSGRQDASGQNRSQYDAAPRLAEFRERMVARGVRSEPVQMTFCTQGNATECAYTIA